MAKEINEISAISYTDKDFGSIYPDMLDLAKELTDKWDPSRSDESDPGVVLLKEAAFVADHNNYNIDKNILENFLPSATQDRSVRNITEMNGYTPNYYVSANGMVTVTLSQDYDEEETGLPASFVIPAGDNPLVISDAEETVSYTQIEDISISGKGSSFSARFIEGTLQTLAINDNNTITLDNLDENNRVYFPETMVAQNGVYVRNVNADDYEDLWERNNYLLTQPNGLRIYKIDYDSVKNLPYIEFPSDISNLIGDGLVIKYIATSGKSGNISANKLVKILSPDTFVDYSGDTRSTSILLVNNSGSITNGKDPETINEMYNNFKRIVGTFDTLITCRDYANKIYSLVDSNDNPYVSNVYVTDRRNDYNKSLNVITYDLETRSKQFKNISTKSSSLSFVGAGTTEPTDAKEGDLFTLITIDEETLKVSGKLQVYTETGWVDANRINLNSFALLTSAMTPYDLVVYALKAFSLSDYIDDIPSSALNKSFKPVSDTTDSQVKSAIENYKCICHTYKGHDEGEVFCFKNYAPISASIVTFNKVYEKERKEILTNVYKALSQNFNAREVEFGTKLDPAEIEKVIVEADPRIKRVDLGSINYKLSALVRSSDGADGYIEIEDALNDSVLVTDLVAKNVLAGRLCLFNFDEDFKYDFGQINGDIISWNKLETEVPITIEQDQSISYATESVKKEYKGFVSTGSNIEYIFNAPNFDSPDSRQSLGINSSYILKTVTIDGDVRQDFLKVRVVEADGTVKSETTYKSEDNITCTITNNLNAPLINMNKSESSKTVKLDAVGSVAVWQETTESSTKEEFLNIDYVLKKNEAVQIIYPNYYSEYTYGVYVNYKFIGAPGDVIYANTEHTLTAGQRIILIYTQDGSEKMATIEAGETVLTTFNISPTDYLTTKGVKKSWTDLDGTFYENDNFRQLATNQTISTRKQMSTLLDNTGIQCYWIITSEADGKDRLFSVREKERILRNDEYFIYTNSSLNEIMILGAGTKLELKNYPNETTAKSWVIDSPSDRSISTISREGTTSDIPWQKNLDFIANPLTITEMNVVTLGENDELIISGWDNPKDHRGESIDEIGNDFVYCDGSIKYIINNTQNVLPKVSNFYQIRSRLDLNMSSSNAQELLENQRILINNKEYSGYWETIESEEETTKVWHSLYMQSSQPLMALGDTIYLDENYRFYSYELDGKTYPRTVRVNDQTTSAEFNFYKGEGIYILPLHIIDSDSEITISIKDADDNDVEFTDYPSSTVYAEATSFAGSTSYYISPKISTSGQLKMTLTWNPITNTNEAILIDDITVIKDSKGGLNPNLNIGSIAIGDVLKRILSIISNSDSEYVKPYYTYRLDNSIAMDNTDFEDANAMWDVNNVANRMTIPQIVLPSTSQMDASTITFPPSLKR